MEKDGEIILNSSYKRHSFPKINSTIKYQQKIFYVLIAILLINIGSIIFYIIDRKESKFLSNLLNDKLLKYKEELLRKISFTNKLIFYYNKEDKTKHNNGLLNTSLLTKNHGNNYSYEEFNEIINEKYIQEQKYFCDNQNIFYNQEFEKKIRLADINFNDKKYKMYVYKKDDIVSNFIIKSKQW
jgi:hypothetical protein